VSLALRCDVIDFWWMLSDCVYVYALQKLYVRDTTQYSNDANPACPLSIPSSSSPSHNTTTSTQPNPTQPNPTSI
jgi:hypothetical protein